MKILIIAEHKNGALNEATQELFGIPLGQSDGVEVHAVIAGAQVEKLTELLARLGAAKVHVIDSPALANYTAESHGEALYQFIGQFGADIVLAAHTPQGKDLMPILAARLDAALASDCNQLNLVQGQVVARRPVYAGKATAEVEFVDDGMKLITVRPRTFKVPEVDDGSTAEVSVFPVNLAEQKTFLKEIIASGNERPDVTEASIIVTGGRSVGSAENFSIIENFADTIGAAVGSSRAAVDAGYRPYRDQVGQTGKVVSPQVYIACGVSGAIQHLAGMRTSKHIIAINTDPDAPIFQVADFGIVGDLFEIVPLLAEESRKRTAG